MKSFMMVLGIAICLPVICSGAVIHVPSDQPTILLGIIVSHNGDTVLVADGTYSGYGNRDITFKHKNITIISENGPESCTIDCGGTPNESHRGFHFFNDEENQSIISGFTIQNGVTSGNPWDPNGGGILCVDSSPTITNCNFTANRAVTGGGIFCGRSSAIISDCTFTANKARSYGGGIACGLNSTITNCTFRENSAEYSGGAIYCSGGIITNCSMSANTGGIGGQLSYWNSIPIIKNCILWNDVSNEIDFNGVQPTVMYSNIQGGFPGIGNINKNPQFISDQELSLTSLSPCIDAGTYHEAPEQDIEGNPRPQGFGIDMGAFEFPGRPSITRVNIQMPAGMFMPGDTCSCQVIVWNMEGESLEDHHLFAVLSVFGQFFYAPTFGGFNFYTSTFQTWESMIPIVPEFTWPEGMGSVDGIVWYAGLANPEMTELVGEMGVFDFGWSE